MDDFKNRKFEYFTSYFEEDSDDNVINESEEYTRTELRDVVDVKDEELSDDSGTVDDKDWAGDSAPPDIVASAQHFKVIREEPRSNKSRLDSDINPSEELFRPHCDQDITDFRRHQVEAYTNLEDLLDEPWEESDFANPTDNELSTNSSSNAKDMLRRRVMKQVGLGQAQCGP